ncbi:MAG: DUF2752 domain-containing protein [Planctomycetota bacterium]
MDEQPPDEAAGDAPARRRSLEHWIAVGIAGGTAAGLAAMALLLAPDPRGYGTHQQLGLLPCLPMELWHLPCPGCGVTTSICLALRGDPWGSVVNQPFGFLVALFLVGFVAWAAVAHLRGRDLGADVRRLRPERALKGLAVLGALAWAYKIAIVRGWIG